MSPTTFFYTYANTGIFLVFMKTRSSYPCHVQLAFLVHLMMNIFPCSYSDIWGFPGGSAVKNLPSMQETQVQSLGWEDPLEEEMATHPSILAWEIPWTEEPGGLQSMGSQKESDTTTKQQQTHASFASWNSPGWLCCNSYKSFLC